MKNVSYEEAIKMIEENPTKRILWTEGLFWKGGGKLKKEISRNSKKYPYERLVVGDSEFSYKQVTINDWKDELKHCFRWACIVDVDKNTNEEIILHGYSGCDMF